MSTPLLSTSSSIGDFSFYVSEGGDLSPTPTEIDPLERRVAIHQIGCFCIGLLASIGITVGLLCSPLPINNPSYQSTEKNAYLAGVISLPFVWVGVSLCIHLRNR
jgi:hypothetical protein